MVDLLQTNRQRFIQVECPHCGGSGNTEEGLCSCGDGARVIDMRAVYEAAAMGDLGAVCRSLHLERVA
jgi:DnaJ-class molecular chaperone